MRLAVTIQSMQLTRHFPSLAQLTKLRLVNAWLVVEDDGLTLIDTTLGPVGARVVAAATSLEAGPIRRIVLTHAHQDHVGGLDSIAPLVPDAEVLVSLRERPILGGDLSLLDGEPAPGPRGGYMTPGTVPTRTIEPGERIGSLLVVATPGHTPGHVSLLDTRNGTLLAGDAMQTAGGLAVIGDTRWLFPLPTYGTWNRGVAAATARTLLDLEPAITRVAPGHGPLVQLAPGQLESVVARAAAKVAPR